MRWPRATLPEPESDGAPLQHVDAGVAAAPTPLDERDRQPEVIVANQADIAADAPARTTLAMTTFSDYLKKEKTSLSSTLRPHEVEKSSRIPDVDEASREGETEADSVSGAQTQRPAPPASPMSLENVFQAIDDLSRGIGAAEDQSQAEGLDMTRRRLSDMLQSEGLEPVARIGDLFDPETHEALLAQHADGEPNRILSIESQGYRDQHNDRLVRRARVVVSAGRTMQSERVAGGGRSEVRYVDQPGRALSVPKD